MVWFPKTVSMVRPLGWKKALGMAAFLVACDPLTPGIPTGTCGNVPACSAFDFTIHVGPPLSADDRPDTATTPYLIPRLGFYVRVEQNFAASPLACPAVGRNGLAHAMTCAPCTGQMVQIDSIYFTSDILLTGGDTLKSGYNFARDTTPAGFSYSALGLIVLPDFDTRFRDSLFEFRYSASNDSVRKSGSVTLRITNPDLLYP
jgi:hypothetical protein